MPTGHFVEDHTVEKSFRYLGKGVKLGDKDRIVCWYKLKDAKDANTYRVVYGDLSVKDVAPEDLPLPVPGGPRNRCVCEDLRADPEGQNDDLEVGLL